MPDKTQMTNPLSSKDITACAESGPMRGKRWSVEIVCDSESEMFAIQDFLIKVRDDR